MQAGFILLVAGYRGIVHALMQGKDDIIHSNDTSIFQNVQLPLLKFCRRIEPRSDRRHMTLFYPKQMKFG